ncbi:nuclear transport factor 2 family protein [Lewinella sp. LCG006]|uniref:nuclear transport factor 2 family protein n=1 Tax=Lewinella sp. LCG006 TaxID=3231911 RepID=UPI00345FC719
MKNISLFLLLLCTTVFTKLQAQSAKEEAAMEMVAHDFMRAYNQQDAAALQNLYTEYATRIDQDGKKLTGADQIAAFFAEQFEQSDNTLFVRHSAVNWSDREHAFVTSGTYEVFGNLKSDGTAVHFTGRYYNSMMEDKGRWLIAESVHLPLEPEQDNLAVIDGLYQAFSSGDIPSVLGALDPQVVWNEAEGNALAVGNPYIGPDAVLNGVFAKIGAEHEYFNLKDIQLREMVDNQVLAILRYDAKRKSNGALIDAQVAHLWTLQDGKVTGFQQYVDTKQLADAAARP